MVYTLTHIASGTKLLYAHPSAPIEMPDNKECRGWAYVGSANLSESAWCVHTYSYSVSK
jgi:hypothetical protein